MSSSLAMLDTRTEGITAMRSFAVHTVLAAALLLTGGEALHAQGGQPDLPPGFTLYQIQGPGVNAPPLPFKIEGGRLAAPEGGLVTVVGGEVGEERFDVVLEVPGEQVRFLGAREGDQLIGYAFMISDEDRDIVPLTMVPAGEEPAFQPDPSLLSTAEGIARVEVVPGGVTLEAGEERRFVARAFDEAGDEIADPEVEWFGSGSRTRMSADGTFYATEAGEKEVWAFVDGVLGWTTVTIEPPTIAELVVFTEIPGRLAVGSRVPIELDALTSVQRWEIEPEVVIASSDPAVLAVEGETLVARAPGRATVTIASGEAEESYPVEVVAAPAGALSIDGLPTGPVRTGDVVRLALGGDARPIWAVAGDGATIDADGAFVAEEPGAYTVVATLDDRVATGRIEVEPRGMGGRIHMNGHGLNTGNFTSDLWPQNRHVYVGTHQSNKLLTYDVSDPAEPVLTDEQGFDARVVNDVKVSADGRWLVATREGAADRRNGILVFSLANPGKPELVSEYTETLTAGVHNVFWVDDLVYAVNDGTGDMHIIDLSDPSSPREVGRWGLPVAGRSLHDVWVQEGIAYLSYLNDGLAILDVGGAGQGGTPTEPVLISRIFYAGGPTHSAMRYGDYVFVGDEDFSLQGTVPGATGTDPRGPIHVIDVSDLERPRYVARYEVPEAGAHNFWIADDVLYIGYYQGGIRAVDISGELRGELYRQGREIAYFLPVAGPDEAKKPFEPRVWGVFPMFENGWEPVGDVLYATDYNSGLWSFTVELPEKPIS